jgi:hypothetical protein
MYVLQSNTALYTCDIIYNDRQNSHKQVSTIIRIYSDYRIRNFSPVETNEYYFMTNEIHGCSSKFNLRVPLYNVKFNNITCDLLH